MPGTQISLDDLFERIRADKSSTFADGAPLSTIQAVQKDLKILFPESLVRFWQEFDGGEFGFGRICSVSSIAAEIEDAYSYNRPLKRWGWVPFGDTYGGDLLCFATIVDEAERICCEVIEWDHEAVVSDVDDDDDDEDDKADDADDNDDDDDDDGDERGLSEDPYLSRYPDFRDLIADYYDKNPQALLDAKEHDRQVEAWKAKAPQDFKKTASDILPIPGKDKPTAIDKHAGLDNRTAMDQRADKRAATDQPTSFDKHAAMEQPTAFDKHAANDKHAATDKPAATNKPAATKNVAETSEKTEKPALAQFLCPHCSNASFQLMWKLELPPSDDWDSEQAQLYKCGGCGFHGIGWYEESRRGSGDAVSQHRGFTVGSLYWKSLAHWFTGCPEPDNKQCSCYSHKWLKQQGRFPELSEHAAWFELKR